MAFCLSVCPCGRSYSLSLLCWPLTPIDTPSTAFESGNQFVGLAGIEQASGGQCPPAAPGAPVDHKARRAKRNIECRRSPLVGHDGADRVLGFGPGDVVEQPRTGRFARKIRRGSFRYRVEIDQSVLDRERLIVSAVAARNRDHLAGFPYPEAGAVGGVGGAARALDKLIAVTASEGADLRADVGDFENCRQELGTAHKGTGPPPPLDQIGLRQFRQRLAHGHSRAAIARHELVLERDAVTRRPFPGQDSALDVESDLLVQRRFVGHLEFVALCGQAHATSLRTAALNVSRAFWRSRWRPPSTTLLPPAQTQATALAPAAKIQPSRTASLRRPASDGCVVSRVTMSARAPARSPTIGCASAWAPPASAPSSSARPVETPGPPDNTLRSRYFNRWPYSS